MKNLLIICIFFLEHFNGIVYCQTTNKILVNDSLKQKMLDGFFEVAYDSIVEVVKINNCLGKKIYYIGTHHIGTEKYYNTIKTKIDSLHKRGYILYYEGTRPDTSRGFLFRRMIIKKYIKIMGEIYDINKQYNEVASKFEGLIAQPIIDSLGGNSADVNADVSERDMVEYYEQKYGTVNDSIIYQKNYNEIRNDIILEFRNKRLYNLIKMSKHRKILILFGMHHKEYLSKCFQEKYD